MNLKIEILVNFDGKQSDLENLVADLGGVLVDWGFGNHPNGGVDSLLVVNNIDDIESEDDISDWLQERVNEGAFAALPIAEMEIEVVRKSEDSED